MSAEYLQDFVDNVVIALHWVDEKGIIKWANKAELDMLGYEAHEYIGRPIADFHADEQKITDILARLSGNESLKGYIAPLRRKDGSICSVSISSNVYRKDGEFVHTRCFSIDISEHVDRNLASESRYQQLVQHLPAAIYTTDVDGRITLFNQAAADLWGREPQIGVDLWCGSWKINKPDGSPLPLDTCPMALTLKEGIPVWGEEIIVVRPDGSMRHVAPFPQPIRDLKGQIIGAFNMLMDITSIRQSENRLKESELALREANNSLEQKIQERTTELLQRNEELKKSEDRYHKMVGEVEDYAILLLDTNGLVQNWNAGAEKIKGYRAEEIVGRHFSVFYLPDDRENGLPDQLIAEAAKNGKALHEGWRVRSDGTTFWGSIVITAIHDDQSRLIGYSKVTRDLSDKKQKDDQIRKYMVQLEAQNKELEQFAFAASHDMKEPLRKIQFYSAAVADNTRGQLDEKNEYYLHRVVQAAQRMQKLIEDILAYTKTTSSVTSLEEVDIETLVTEFIELNKEEIEQHGILIRFGNLPSTSGIFFQMEQLVNNLLNNSIKYRHPERQCIIEITGKIVDAADIPLPQAGKHAAYNLFSFADNGIGFDAIYADKIFEIFQRLNPKNDTPGTGVGLAICKKIVQNHQGFIIAESAINAGARFDVYLPVT